MKTVLMLALVVFLSSCGGDSSSLSPVNGAVRVPVSALADGKAKYYSIKIDDKDVKFFALKSSDGVIRAAFDACDVCFQSRKGYRQDGEFMICNNCGMRFHSSKINEVKGGCNPAPIERTVEGDNLLILVENLKQGKRFF